jgi:hypothetical protein
MVFRQLTDLQGLASQVFKTDIGCDATHAVVSTSDNHGALSDGGLFLGNDDRGKKE